MLWYSLGPGDRGLVSEGNFINMSVILACFM